MAEERKLLSIIVPSYNMEGYLPKCLESLVVDDNELLQKLDVIVVNDGSKDHTSEIAHEFEAKYPSVFRVIDKENGHYGSCINAGLRIMRGDFVRIVDSDDSVETDEFVKFIKYLGDVKHSDPDVVISNFCKVNVANKVITKIVYSSTSTGLLPPNCLLEMSFPYIGAVAITYNSSIFTRIQYSQLEGYPYTDTQWAICPFFVAKSVLFAPFNVVRYFVGREGQTMDPKELMAGIDKHAYVSLNIYKEYTTTKSRIAPESRQYVEHVITENARWMVLLYATGYGGFLPESSGEEFDCCLKKLLPDIYAKTDGLYLGRFIKFRYAKEWRKGYTRDTPAYKLFALKNMLMSKIKSLCKG